MPNKDLVELVYILDRSGSMADRIGDVIGGYNRLIEDQKKQPGKADVTLVIFDEHLDRIFQGEPIDKVPALSQDVYFARGMTALHDAIGRTATEIGQRLARKPENDRPGKVIVTIFTDGLENSSREFDGRKIRQIIEHQREKYGWDFTFLGANQDAVLTGQAIGIPMAAAMTFNAKSALGVANVIGAASAYASVSRGGGLASYSMVDREDAMAEDGPTKGGTP